MQKRHLCWILATSFLLDGTAKTISGTSTYQVPETESLYEARHEALARARIEALEQAFGSLVSLVNISDIDKDSVSFRSIGQSEVRGVWLKDLAPPKQEVRWDDKLGVLTIETTVKGNAEELKPGRADIQCVILRNATDARAVEDKFKDGDHLYLQLRTSEKGYVAAFLMDDSGDVHTALPYRGDTRSCVEIDSGVDYIFFSPENAPANSRDITDSYRLRTHKRAEICRICVVFSPNRFSRSIAEKYAGSDRTKKIDYEDFDKWLMQLRAADPKIQFTYRDIIIRKQ
ncbi:MAG: DUF4384 domain-containing protein [Muribaculaceae bacterium]|nr:DUF4384 domain-containing protein [Muribaculaceae bacterium]